MRSVANFVKNQMIGAVTEVTQDPEKAGSAMKILSLRLRGMKGELEEIESGASEGVESISKMQTQIINMTRGRVNIFDENGEFKSTYEIMEGIAGVWDSLNSIDQANLLETIAGKHRANDVGALIENWGRASDMAETGLNSAGSAAEENARTVDSLQGRINALTATWQDFANTVMESDLLKGLVSAGSTALGVFTELIDKIGTIPTLLAAIAGGMAFSKTFSKILPFSVEKSKTYGSIGDQLRVFGKTAEEIKALQKSATSNKPLSRILGDDKVRIEDKIGKDGKIISSSNVSSSTMSKWTTDIKALDQAAAGAKTSLKGMSAELKEYLRNNGYAKGNNIIAGSINKGSIEKIKGDLKGIVTAQEAASKAVSGNWKEMSTAVNHFNQADAKQKQQMLDNMKKMDTATANYFSKIQTGANGGQASMKGLIVATTAAKLATIGLQIAATAASMALTMGLTFAIQKLVEGAMWLQKTFLPTAKQTAEAVVEIMDNFEELNDKAKNAKKVAQDVGKSYVEFSKGVNTLTNENKNLSTEEYQQYLDVSNQIAEAMPSLVKGYDDQGNAILTCAGNVEKLADAYKELQIKANDAILGDASTIIKDFENDMKKAAGKNWKDWGFLSWIDDDMDKESYDQLSEWSADFTAANFEALESINEMRAATQVLGTTIGTAIGATIGSAFGGIGAVPGVAIGHIVGGLAGTAAGYMLPYLSQDVDNLDEISKAFEQLGYDKKKSLGGLVSEDDLSHITRVLEEDPNVSQKIMRAYEDTLEPLADEMRDVASAHISNAFLEGDYDEISDSMESMITQMVPNLSTEFFQGFIDEDGNFSSLAFYDELNSIMDTFNTLSPQQEKKFEVFIDMQSKYNNGEITVNEYLAELDRLESMLSTFDPEVQKSIKLVLGIDGESVITDKNAIMDDLENELDMSDEIAEYFVGNMSSGELKVMYDLIADGKIDKSMIDEYEQVYSDFVNMAEGYGRSVSDLSRSIWGNIDMDDREAIEWNAETLYKYGDAIETWGDSVKSLKEGDVSTVLGASKQFGEGIEGFNDGKGIEIAFSPILQTEDGAELLSSDAVDKYINGILEKALEDGEFSEAELMSLDITGLEVGGQKVSGLIAAIGDDARYTGEALHYMGEEGALAMTRLVQEYGREAKLNAALEYTIDMSAEGAEVTSMTALNTALQETVSGSGLTAGSISALRERYSDLAAEGYDLSKMFDVSSNGIRLNRRELGKLEAAYSKQKFDETAEHIDVLKKEYDELNKTISDPSATAAERANANSRQKMIQEQINSLGILMAQYDGLSSAYNRWQNLESAGQERDMYENIIQGLDTLDDETGRGWIDDGSIALLEVLTGRTDLATASAEELKKVYGDLDDTINSAGYSIRDFFTVDDEGNSTNKGVYNFLRTVEALENSDVLNSEGIAFKDMEGIENLVQKDDSGKIVAFDFKVAGGDEAIAEALGVGEELVQIMLRAADDAGFVVNIEGAYTAMAELETAAEESVKRINEAFGTNINLEANGEDFVRSYAQTAGLLAQYQNEDGTIKAEFVTEDGYVQEVQDIINAMTVLTHQKDDLEEPAYMSLDASDVEAELQKPLEDAQYFQDLLRAKHIFEIDGNTEGIAEVEAEMMKIADSFAGLPNHIKDSLDIEGLSVEQIYDKLEAGELQIPTALDLQLEMNESLDMLVKTALYEAGLMSGDQQRAFEEELKIFLDPSVDASGVDEEIDQAVDGVANKENSTETTANVSVKAGEIDTGYLENEVIEGVPNVVEVHEDVEAKADVNIEAGEIESGYLENEIITGTPNVIDVQTDVKVDAENVDTSAAQERIQEAFNNGDKVTFTGGEYYYDSYGSTPLGSMYQGQDVYVTNTNQGATRPYHISTGSQLGDGDLGWVGEYQIVLVPTIDPNADPYALLREDEYVIDVDADTSKAEETIDNSMSLLREGVDYDPTINVDADVSEAEEKIDNSMSMLREGVDYDPTVSIDADISEVEEKVDEVSSLVDGIGSDGIGEPSGINEFIEGAEALKEIGSFETNITANVFGNVVDEWEFRLNNLQEFAKGAHLLKDVGSFETEVSANVFGNVIDEFEFRLNNLQEFAKGALLLENVGTVNTSVAANVYGNVIDEFEYKINNLEEFGKSAQGLRELGSFSSNITANVFGNVTDEWEFKLNNLEEFAESAMGLKGLGSFGSNVAANVSGNVIDEFEFKLNNLGVFVENAQGLKELGSVTSNVTANIGGNVDDTFEFKINNLKTFVESAQGLKELGSVTSNVTASLNGNIDDTFEFKINNLETLVESAQGLKEIGTITSSVTANVGGNVLTEFEFSINNLETFAEGANLLKDLGTVSATVNANIDGDVDDTFEFKINNLIPFAEAAQKLKDVGDANVTVTGNVGGAVLTTPEFMTNNLLPFAEAAQKLSGIDDVSTTITANIDGDVDDTFEFKINNLIPFADAAQKLSGIGDVSTNITATINNADSGTNATDMWEAQINNLIPFAEAASKLNGVGDVSTTITATLQGELNKDINLEDLIKFAQAAGMLQGVQSCEVVIDAGGELKWQGSVDTLIQFAQAAKELQGVESREVVISASVTDGLTVEEVNNLGVFANVVSSLSTVPSPTVSVTINVDSASVDNAIATMQKLADNSGLFHDYTSTINVNGNVYWFNDSSVVDAFKSQIHEATGTVKWSNNEVNVKKYFTANGTVNWTSGNNVQVRVLQSAVQEATGTAHSGGTAGRAFARGNWGIKGSGVALGGELGQELVVRDGQFFTIGDNGAEFFEYKQNDIIFNARQTEELFKYGGIKGAQPRGKMLASGSAFAGGSFPTSGRAFWNPTGSNTTESGSWGEYSGGGSSSSSSKSSSSSSSDAADEFKEKIDWIEVAIDRIERAISRLDLKASSIFQTWTTRNNALTSQMSKVREEIDLQTRAATRYKQEAESVGLSWDYAMKVMNGEIDIETITDEDLKEKIDEFQQWYEKMLDCQEAAEELKETLSELYAQKFDNIITEFEGIIAVAEHEKNMLEEAISQSEAKGRITSTSYYDALIAYEKENQDTLIAQKEAMLAQLNENVASGAIKEGSEEWVKEVTAINDVTLAIEGSETALLDYAKTMRELEWEQFEALQDRISHITEETEFLIDLMSNDKLYDDKGQLTNEGIATVGLHGVNYNTYMHKADMYGEEAEKAYAAWQADPANKDLEDHYYEMLELRRENILLAEGEVDAYKDIVEEGINIELDALQELIDKKNEALQSEKDAYEYSKKVAEQTKEIAALEKQMAAYSGDDSEETKAKIQELKVSLEEAKTDLEETEYDKYISDQEALLDELYLEYETILNERLDNVDLLLQSMIDTTNANAATINETLSGVAGGVGTEMSTIMSSIFGTEGENNVANVITAYDKNFGTTMTGVKGAIDGIKAYTDMLKKKADDEAAAKAAKAKESNAAKSKEASGSASTSGSSNNNNKNNNNKNTTSGDGTPKVGDKVKFVSGSYYYDSQGKSPTGSKYQGKEVYITSINNASWATHPYHISTGSKLGSGDLGWLKLNQLSGYATGKKNFLSDELGWTQENGREFIIRPSDGAILTPLAKSDSVLSAAASSNLWNMANSPAEFIRDSLGIGDIGAPVGSGGTTSVEQHFDQIVFNMPNVKNYEQMLVQMQKDKNFQRLIDSMGVDQIAGKSALRKNKSIR